MADSQFVPTRFLLFCRATSIVAVVHGKTRDEVVNTVSTVYEAGAWTPSIDEFNLLRKQNPTLPCAVVCFHLHAQVNLPEDFEWVKESSPEHPKRVLIKPGFDEANGKPRELLSLAQYMAKYPPVGTMTSSGS